MSPTRTTPPTLRFELRPIAGDDYRVELKDVTAGGDAPAHTVTITAADIRDWRATSRHDPDAVGVALAARLFTPPFLAFYRERIGRSPTGRVRVEFCIHDAGNPLHALPWELMHGPARDAAPLPLAADEATPFARFDALRATLAEPLPPRPLRLLVFVANPWNLDATGMDGVAVAPLLRALLETLAPHSRAGRVQVTVLAGVTELPGELTAALHAAGWKLAQLAASLDNLQRHAETCDLLYLTAHGRDDGLLLEADGGAAKQASAAVIADKVNGAGARPHLIFLAACYSGARAGADAFAALGPMLHATGVPAVVAMQDAVTMDAARQLAADFFAALLDPALAAGQVDLALNRARRLLYDRQTPVWAPPVLFCRLRDGVLFDGEAAPRWRVPFLRNAQFVGRDDDLAALHAALQGAAAVGIRPAGLTGLGGIGKTQLAVEYCHRYRDSYPGGVFWLNAAGEWLPAFAELGRFLDEDQDGKALDRQARAVAEYFTAHPDSLLVLDNVQDPARLRAPVTPELTPAHLPCRVIFTTRRRDLGDFQPVELASLPEEPGLHLLLRHPARQPALVPAHPDHAAAVSTYTILGGLPLALEIAGAHLGRLAHKPIATYRDELLKRGALAVVDDPRGGVKDADLGTRHAAAVAATLAEQWDALQSEEARLLLRVAGQFTEAEVILVPRLGLLAGISDRDVGFFGAPLALALDELHAAALVERLAGDAIRLHPLVRDFAARRTPPADVDAFRSQCAGNLLAAYRDFATLEDHCARRGADELELDLRTAIVFVGHDASLQSPLSQLLRMLQRESHSLHGWDAVGEPGRFSQQWLKRALIEGDIPMQDQARCGLRHAPYLEATWLVAHTDKALERTLSKFGAGVIAAIATPDGQKIISASSNGLAAKDETLAVWNLATGQEERTLTLRDARVRSIAVTPDGQRVILASSGRTLTIWNIGNGVEERSLKGKIDDIMAMGVTRDGRWLITASSSGAMQVWDCATNSSYPAVGRSRYLNTVVVAAHAQQVIYPSNVDFTLQITDLSTDQEYTLPGDASSIDVVATTPDGETLIAALSSGALKVWEPATGRDFTLHEKCPNVTALALFADGRRAISGSLFGELAIWDLPSGQKKATLCGHVGRINSVVVTADGQRAISASADATLKVWNLATVAGKTNAGGLHSWIHAVAVTAHGRVIASAEDGALKMWNLSTGAEEHPLLGHMGRVTVMALTTDGRIALGTGKRTLKFWNPVGRGEAPIVTVEQIDTAGDIVAVAPGGEWVIAAEGDKLELWNRETHVRSRLSEIGWNHSIKLALAATPDGRVVAGSIDGRLRMWEPETLKVDHIMTEPGAQVTAATVTPDGQRVISGSSHGRLSIWDRAHGEMMASILLEAAVTCVAVAPDGVTIVAGDAAGNVYCLRYQEATADA